VLESNVIEMDSLTEPLPMQAEVEIVPGVKTELWTIKDSVVQFLKTLHLAERRYQVFA